MMNKYEIAEFREEVKKLIYSYKINEYVVYPESNQELGFWDSIGELYADYSEYDETNDTYIHQEQMDNIVEQEIKKAII